MRGTHRILILALLFATTKLPLVAQGPPDTTSEEPSILRTFVKSTKNASVRTKTLGTLKGIGDATATFAAVVAWDQENPEVKVKGLTVRLKDQKKDATIYIDDDRDEEGYHDSLEDFQDSLAVLLADLTKIPEKALHSNERDAYGETTSPENGRYGQGAFLTVDVLNVGWWWNQAGDRTGVVIECRYRAQADCPQHGRLYFPDASISQVIGFVAGGKEFLDSM